MEIESAKKRMTYDRYVNYPENRIYIRCGVGREKPDDDCLTKEFGDEEFSGIYIEAQYYRDIEPLLKWLVTQKKITNLVIAHELSVLKCDPVHWNKIEDDVKQITGSSDPTEMPFDFGFLSVWQESAGFEKLARVLCSMPSMKEKLRSITFAGLKAVNRFQYIASLLRHCKNVEQLTLVGMDQTNNDYFTQFTLALLTCKNLEKIALFDMSVDFLSFNEIFKSLCECPKLSSVSLVGNNIFEQHLSVIKKFVTNCYHREVCTLTLSLSDFLRKEYTPLFYRFLHDNSKLRAIYFLEPAHARSSAMGFTLVPGFKFEAEDLLWVLSRSDSDSDEDSDDEDNDDRDDREEEEEEDDEEKRRKIMRNNEKNSV